MTDWRRFHRAAVLFETLRAVRDGGLPIAVLVFAGALGGGLDRGDLVRACVYLGIGATVATVVGIVRWKTTLWRVTPTDIGRRSGVLSREERRVPVTRIQSVDAIRGPLQRVLGVETLQIETGVGGRHAEIVLTAVTPEEAAMLRRLAGGAVAEEPADAAAGVPVRRLRASELLLAALTAGRVGAIAAAGAAASQVAGQLVDDSSSREELDALRRVAPDTVLGWVALAAVALALVWLVAIAGAVVAFAGFTLTREGDRLRIRRGLISVRESAVPVRRVQAVRVVEGMLRQPLGLATIRVETLGYGDEPPANQTLFPLVRRHELPVLLAEFLPEQARALDGLRRPPPRALPRYVLRPVAVAAVAAVALAVLTPAHAAATLLILVAALLGVARWHGAGWRLDPDGGAALRERRLARSTLLFATRRAQLAEVSQSVLQRRARLADISVTVGPATGHVRSLDAPTAWRLWEATRPHASA